MPRDGVLLQESDGVANRDSGARSVVREGRRFGARKRHAAQPEAFDQTYGRMRMNRQNRRTALASDHGVAQQKDIGGRAGIGQLRRFVGQHRASGRIFSRQVGAIRILKPFWMQRKCENGLAANGWRGFERYKSNRVFGRERIWSGAKNGHVMLQILGDNADLDQPGRRVGAIHENVRLAAVAKRLEDVSDGEEIALLVNEKGVAEKRVVIAAPGGALVIGIDDGAERRVEGRDC